VRLHRAHVGATHRRGDLQVMIEDRGILASTRALRALVQLQVYVSKKVPFLYSNTTTRRSLGFVASLPPAFAVLLEQPLAPLFLPSRHAATS